MHVVTSHDSLVILLSSAAPAWSSSDPVKEHNANVSLANAFMNKMESYSQAKKPEQPTDEAEAEPEAKPAEDKPLDVWVITYVIT